MDYKQHKGNLRGQIKNQIERKLYNKRIRIEGKNADMIDDQVAIHDTVKREHSCETCIWYASAKTCKTCNKNRYHLIENGDDLLVSTWHSNDLIKDYRKTL
jgi:hypothetical protein